MNIKQLLRAKGIPVGLSVVLAAIILGGGGYALYRAEGGASPIGSASTPTMTPGQNVSVTSTPTPTITIDGNEATFTGNGLSFTFATKDASGVQYSAKIVGNRVYVYQQQFGYQGSSFIEVFSKVASDSIQQAISKAILSGYVAADCPITIDASNTEWPSGTQEAHVSYAANNLGSAFPGPIDASKCPSDYTQVTGSRYFSVFPSHTDKLVFLNLEAGAAPADTTASGKLWFQTLSFQ